jgi:hypothetical protein
MTQNLGGGLVVGGGEGDRKNIVRNIVSSLQEPVGS